MQEVEITMNHNVTPSGTQRFLDEALEPIREVLQA
jgi:hypothetical protein